MNFLKLMAISEFRSDLIRDTFGKFELDKIILEYVSNESRTRLK